jgi:hypothetical protein
MEAAFDRLYEKVIVAGADPQLDVEFRAAASEYFNSYIGSVDAPAAHDHFFYGFSPLWIHFRSSWRVDLAEEIWRIALDPAQEWERTHSGNLIDKGVPYYYWAMTALLLGRIDRGYVLAHQAAEEDRRTSSSGFSYPDTPAYALVSLNYDKDDQAFKVWVDEQASFLKGVITDYSNVYGRSFNIDDIRNKFLRNPPNHEVIFLLTYTIARLKEISEIPVDAKRNLFVGQLQLNLLFDLLLVIGDAIKQKNSSKWKFVDHATYLLDHAGRALRQLGVANAQFETGFGSCMADALDGRLIINGKILDRLQCDIAIAYVLRNRAAHNIGSESVIWNEFDRIQGAVFRTFCATIDYLY